MRDGQFYFKRQPELGVSLNFLSVCPFPYPTSNSYTEAPPTGTKKQRATDAEESNVDGGKINVRCLRRAGKVDERTPRPASARVKQTIDALGYAPGQG